MKKVFQIASCGSCPMHQDNGWCYADNELNVLRVPGGNIHEKCPLREDNILLRWKLRPGRRKRAKNNAD